MKLSDSLDAGSAGLTGSVAGFHFSAVRPETLGATEYTLVTLVLDKTGSVAAFAPALFGITQAVVEACRRSPRADYLLLRLVEFASEVDEVHGFKPLADILGGDYLTPACHGLTALNDALFAAVSASNAYGQRLAEQDYLANAIVIVATDGDDNASHTRVADLRAELQRGVQAEHLESLRSVLVGINAGQHSASLQAFQQAAGLDQYVDVADATPQKLAQLAAFVSRSISAQSQALGTGGPSQALTF